MTITATAPKKGKRRFGLKEKFLTPLICITFFILCATTFAMLKAEKALLATAREELINAAETMGHKVDLQIQRAQMDIVGASYLPEIKKVLSPAEKSLHVSREQFIAHVNRILSAFSGAANIYEAFYVTSEDGITLASCHSEDVGNISIAEQSWFYDALRKGRVITSSPYVSPRTGEMLLTVIKKISHEDLAGTIAGALKLGHVISSALSIGTQDGVQVAVVTGSGHVLGSCAQPNADSPLGDQPWMASVLRGEQGYFPITDDGEDKMMAFHRLESSQLFAVAIAKRSDLLAPAIFLHKLSVGIFLVALTLIGCNIYYTIVPLIRSIRDLARTANQIGSGDLAQRIETARNDEVGDLATSLADMLDTLKAMIYQAEAATRAKSDFLARMSHEIRTPLNAIIGMAYLRMQDKNNDEQRDSFAKIHGAATHLLEIVNDILDFSKIEADKLDLQAEPFSIRDAVESTLSLVRGKAEEKGLDLSCSIDKKIPDILIGDALRFFQICTNLCANAVKFTDQGSVTITLSLENRGNETVTIRFSVADTGIGMTEEQQKDIFDAFSQADGSITRRFGGTGLGLTICKKLAALMGGSLQAASAPGHGSVFHFTVSLPISPKQDLPAAAPQAPAIETASVKSARILVVEDNKLNQEVTVGMLRLMGITPTLACNGLEALEICRKESFDLIFMDIQMPGMDGLEATRRLRREPTVMSSVPIIAMTANALHIDRLKSLEAGMNAHLTKPFSHAKLAETIRLWCAKTTLET